MAKMNRGHVALAKHRNIISLEALQMSSILTTLWDEKWPTTHNAAPFFLSEVISDFPSDLSCHHGPFSPQALNSALD